MKNYSLLFSNRLQWVLDSSRLLWGTSAYTDKVSWSRWLL